MMELNAVDACQAPLQQIVYYLAELLVVLGEYRLHKSNETVNIEENDWGRERRT